MLVLIVSIYQNIRYQHTTALPAIDVTTSIDVQPGRYYQTDGQYHLDLNGTDRLKLPLKNLPDNISAYHTLVIKKFQGFKFADVYLTAQANTLDSTTVSTLKHKLINNTLSINQLDQEWQHADNISDVAIVVEIDNSLGFSRSSENQISWQSIQFTDNVNINQFRQLMSKITAFIPLHYSSINLHNRDSVHIYQSILMWLAGALLILVVLYYIVKPAAIHLMAGIFILWLMATVIYGLNFKQQIQFNQVRFAKNYPYLNQMDRRLATIANSIHEAIVAQGTSSADTKLLIIGDYDFAKKRLKYHLLRHNVGIVSDYKSLQDNLMKTNNYAILLPPFNDVCEDNQPTDASTAVTLLKSTQFCLQH